MSTTIIYVGVNIILYFPITYKNASVLCQFFSHYTADAWSFANTNITQAIGIMAFGE